VVVAADGRRASRRRVAVRTAVKLLPWQIAHLAVTRAVGAVPGRHAQQAAKAGFGAALGLAALSAACAAGRADGRALHDLVAGTRVVPDDGDDTDGGRR
jgi:uncharacterized RDD family membrane protein YckC